MQMKASELRTCDSSQSSERLANRCLCPYSHFSEQHRSTWSEHTEV